ncbi:hypothetical protein EG352_07910 [Chryseobacterium indologenes]|uniref:Uncharacterized protein n=1 Tax=Chryseobacterium indologenes TaxID=253 RepID=A0AAD1DVB9_CHRID|nr:hypothetical protein [Chryseobacterium indologenes]AZB17698.1 hypothetical protein EG352_07910 [Chryseobacterium indologenes]
MNNTVKIALIFITGGYLLYLGSRKKSRKKKSFIAPDGVTYTEDTIYRSYDNKLYKNGKEIHFKIPELYDVSYQHWYDNAGEKIPVKQRKISKEVMYHHKGLRHQ